VDPLRSTRPIYTISFVSLIRFALKLSKDVTILIEITAHLSVFYNLILKKSYHSRKDRHYTKLRKLKGCLFIYLKTFASWRRGSNLYSFSSSYRRYNKRILLKAIRVNNLRIYCKHFFVEWESWLLFLVEIFRRGRILITLNYRISSILEKLIVIIIIIITQFYPHLLMMS